MMFKKLRWLVFILLFILLALFSVKIKKDHIYKTQYPDLLLLRCMDNVATRHINSFQNEITVVDFIDIGVSKSLKNCSKEINAVIALLIQKLKNSDISNEAKDTLETKKAKERIEKEVIDSVSSRQKEIYKIYLEKYHHKK